MTTRYRLVAVVAGTAVALGLAGCGQPPGPEEFALSEALSNPEMPLPDGAAASLRYVTFEVCDSDVACVEAWDSDVGLFLRFTSLEDASDYEASSADAVVDRYVVIDFSEVDVPQDVQNEVEGIVFAQLPPEHAPFRF